MPTCSVATAALIATATATDTTAAAACRPMWNMTGMMNNCQYVVKLHPDSISEDGGADGSRTGLRFEHPVTEGVGGHGGWMMTEKDDAAGALAGITFTLVAWLYDCSAQTALH